jgi:hypothetical protein
MTSRLFFSFVAAIALGCVLFAPASSAACGNGSVRGLYSFEAWFPNEGSAFVTGVAEFDGKGGAFFDKIRIVQLDDNKADRVEMNKAYSKDGTYGVTEDCAMWGAGDLVDRESNTRASKITLQLVLGGSFDDPKLFGSAIVKSYSDDSESFARVEFHKVWLLD